ncbi:electron transport complex subunit G [Colwellia marinimaniae]|uniref:Ion-translocating oxidoreductase complex subunit G n=1 Tax=Colwellia marinimaniae TaxID=1513592 RepID=A0ABQ0MS36_9GAMM|nr:electron transport complex subunit RsxG [Colwellia marinimaniae]GAW95188.1 electron transport complex subunit G [Colwellia marinimaniae]
MSNSDNDIPKKSSTKPTKNVVEKSALTIAISKNTKILALFAIACTFAVGLVSELTKERIKQQEQIYLLKTLHSIIEPSRYDNDIANDCIMISAPELGINKVHTAYIARKAGQVIAVAMTSTAPKGYNGNIDFIMAINNDGSVSGVRVLKHQETPGLGDKIEIRKSNWITSFTGKRMLSEDDSRWAVSKDNGMFDQFTGATITPRAIVDGVKNTLIYFTKNKASLLTRPNACGEDKLKSTSTPIKHEAENEQ